MIHALVKCKHSTNRPDALKYYAFTLLEMVITLALAILILGTAVPAVGKAAREEALREPSREIQKLVRSARQAAIREQKPKVLRFSKEREVTKLLIINSINAALENPPVEDSYSLPREIRILCRTWHDEKWSEPRAIQWFLQPTGLMEPIQFRLERNQDWIEFEFHPLTGNISEERFMFP